MATVLKCAEDSGRRAVAKRKFGLSEARMNDSGSPKLEGTPYRRGSTLSFVARHSFVIRHSSFSLPFMSDLWTGLKPTARDLLSQRDYSAKSLGERLATTGVEAGELIAAGRAELMEAWIPGVEVFARRVFPQRHRGFFGELARQEDGALAAIGFWPKQWATARMFATTAKGFHIHPPHVPPGTTAESWFLRLFVEEPANLALRPYAREQWDAMFFIQGSVEMLLADERAGLVRRVMRFIVEGDDCRGPNNAGVIIPPGVAHALRVEGSTDAIMVYGTSTQFDPAFEGRIADGIERAPLPAEWERYLGSAK
jgi:dTDP-4-dehydrorhamnose 3,5-epimerase-like enzyme